jgi:hypothetical protein
MLAEISGVVTNATTNAPQANVSISLVQPGAGGMQSLGTAISDAEGKFKFDKPAPQGPALLQGTYKDVTYTTILQPGAPTEGVRMSVNDTTTKTESNTMLQHIYIFEPGDDMRVTETFLMSNETKATFFDPAKGSIQIHVPNGADPKDLGATVEGTAGMSIRRPLEKTSQPGVYKLAYAIKPGEARLDVHYSIPLAEKYAFKILRADGPSRIATPSGVTMEGTGFRDLGQEPRTQAHLYEVTAGTFEAKIKGSGSLNAGREEDNNAPKEDDGSPKPEVVDARVYSRIWWVMGLSFGILALGGTFLFRRGVA